ncbi:DNA recombination protein RmuC [Glycocaulis profundi]|nr:DNA recombination protein RmuC [Glycocaulis profundi]
MDPVNLAIIVFGAAALVAAVLLGLMAAKAGRRAEEAREALAEARQKLAMADGRAASAEAFREDLARTREKLSDAEQERAALKSQMAERDAAVARERESLTKLSEEMREKFKLLAGEALDTSQTKFLERAAETFKVQQEKGEAGVKGLVDPIRQRLEEFKAKVEQIEKERAGHRGEMGQQIAQLTAGLETQRAETSKLVNALQRSSTTRGQWGERTVENILELAGLSKGIDYDSQHQTRDSEGAALRPDFVVRLPGGGRFVIDSKVALTGFLDAVEAADETEKKNHLRRHAAQVRTHMKQLAKKEYAKAVDGAIDFVALFIPGESFYSAAVDEDPALFDDAIAGGVIIVTPATLLALAKAVSYGWRQQALEDNAQKIAALGAEIHDRLSTFSDHLGRVGSGLKSATTNYNKAVASLEGRVMVSARKMADLNGAGSKALAAPEQVDETPRSLSAPEAGAAADS